MPLLSKSLVLSSDFRDRTEVDLPDASLFDLPEKVLQFGTGALLRGFTDYFIDRANRAGLFGGRVVMVGSTGSGRSSRLNEQDGLFTLCVQGLDQGEPVERRRVVASISRALSARDAWGEVLDCARNADLSVVVSNTTEIGIQLDPEDRLDLDPPRSFPGKLTAFLYERARAFDYAPDAGLVVLPCELIESNGDVLRGMVLDLAGRWELGDRFVEWVERHNPFCNTLVDRIVPGTPDEATCRSMYDELGYEDDLLTVAEIYRLWAIEGDEELARRIGFAGADPGIVVTGDITPYRERKVRILNGTHTIMVPTAFLCGSDTVREAVEHPVVSRYIRRVMKEEIVPSLDIDPEMARAFADEVLYRFGNPFIRHELLGIMLQATMKMRVRIVPSLLAYYEKTGRLADSIAFGFAAFLLFMRGEHRADPSKLPRDDRAPALRAYWEGVEADDVDALERFVTSVCRDEELWGTRLDAVPGFVHAVTQHLHRIRREGVLAALSAHLDAADHTV